MIAAITESDEQKSVVKNLTPQQKERLKSHAVAQFKGFLDMGILAHQRVSLEAARFVCNLLALELIAGRILRDEYENHIVGDFHRQLNDAGLLKDSTPPPPPPKRTWTPVAELEVLTDLEMCLSEGEITQSDFLEGYEGSLNGREFYEAVFYSLVKQGKVRVDFSGSCHLA